MACSVTVSIVLRRAVTHGRILVDAFATRWGCEQRSRFTKTVWAEVSL
ncbi:hypothetical protein [Streptomyces bobili]